MVVVGVARQLQASYMHRILLAKVRVWAEASGGCFPTAGLDNGQEQNQVAKYNRSVLFKWAKVSLSKWILPGCQCYFFSDNAASEPITSLNVPAYAKTCG